MATGPLTPTPVSTQPMSGTGLIGSTDASGQVAPLHQTKGQVFDTVLHDFVLLGMLAASVFVKNPQSRAKAGAIMNLVQQAMPILDAQLNPGNPTAGV